MNRIVLATKRRWNWKVFLALVGLNAAAAFAILPYTIYQQKSSLTLDLLVLDRLINILLIAVLGGLGLLLANRIGLGLPFVEGRARRESVPTRFRNIAAIAWVTAVLLVLLSLLLHALVFDPPLNALLLEMGIVIPKGTDMPPMYGFLAAISAGIIEETLYRLFGLSLLAWLGGLLFHDPDGRPKPAVFWTANILFALVFGLAHLPAETAIGLPLNPLVVTATLVLNGIGGLAFGWLFWTFGLECAMLAHILADIVMHSLIPLISIQEGDTARTLAMGVVMAAIMGALIWAFRSLIMESRRQQPKIESS